MKIKYLNHGFTTPSLVMLETAEEIIKDYSRQGYRLTLRQLYYQFVSRDLIPNKEASYKKLGNLMKKGREAGLIDWSAIEDRTRGHASFSYEEDIEEEMPMLKKLPGRRGMGYGLASASRLKAKVWKHIKAEHKERT